MAIQDLPAGTLHDDSPAFSLLDNVPELEHEVLMCEADEDMKTLEPISCKESGERAIISYWRWKCRLNREALAGLTLGSLHRAVAKLEALADETFLAWLIPLSVARQLAKDTLIAALGAALHRAGFQLEHMIRGVRHSEIGNGGRITA